MNAVVDKIHELGLDVVGNKTEAMWFVKETRRRKPPRLTLTVNWEVVPVETEVKYLGVRLDSCLTFGSHFTSVALKIEGAANFLDVCSRMSTDRA